MWSSTATDAAAPGPSIPFSSTSTRMSSRAASRTRQPSPPPKSRARQRPPNDISMNAASADVISDLLASFPAIGFPDPSEDPLPPQPPMLRSSRRPSKTATPRLSISPSRAPPNTTHRFVVEVQHPIEDVAELPPDEDAAEPPVVRTSRPPSGLTRPKPPRWTKDRVSQSPQPRMSPPPERAGSGLAQSRDTRGLRSGFQSPQSINSRRGSLESTRSRESFQQRFFRLTSRNKNRDFSSPSRGSLRAAENDSQRAGRMSSSVQTPVYRSVVHSARLSEDDEEDAASPGPTVRRLQAVPEQSSSQPRLVMSARSRYVTQLSTTTAEQSMAEMHSSLIGPSSSPSIYSKLQTNRSVADTGTIFIANDPEPSQHVAMMAEDDGSDDDDDDDDDNETDVMRRIRELKAARDERRRSLKSDAPDMSLNGQLSLNDQFPNTTTLASKQLAEAQVLDERTVGGAKELASDPYLLETPATRRAPNNFSRLKPPVPELSKERAFIVESRGSTTRSTARPSLDTPNLSQPGSKTMGRSPGSSPVVPAPSSPQNQHRRNRLSFSRTSALPEDGRPSIDSINASVQEFLSAPRLSQQLYFPSDGRRISFSEVGDPNGYVVFCCVGMGLTRYIMAYYDELATSLKLRLITPERPGIGDSEPYAGGSESPYNWPDDVQVICAKLGITKFSILAHSAGVIYALATALRMSQFLRGRMHLLAPWIPPSQLTNSNVMDTTSSPSGALPRSQRFLRMLPTSFLKLSNSKLTGMSRNNSPKSSPGRGRKSSDGAIKPSPRPSFNPQSSTSGTPRLVPRANTRPPSPRLEDVVQIPTGQDFAASMLSRDNNWGSMDVKQQQRRQYDAALTPAIWERATRNANPAVDLIICLERTRPIGFRYADVGSKPAQSVHDGFTEVPGSKWPGYGIVIHHGSKDTRVPVENARWLGKVMPNAEVRVLEGQGHGLMAVAGVMGSVLTEIGKEWENSRWI